MIQAATEKTMTGAATTVGLVGIVDDDESIRNSISSLLRSAGFQTLVFDSAEAFLDSGRIHETDRLVLDVRMPGLSGLELQRRLHHMNSFIPIIFVTAHSDHDIERIALEQGAIAFFGKPFNDEALLSSLSVAVDSGSNRLPL